MNKKSVSELLGVSFSTFKESFWGIAATYIFALILIVIATIILPKSLMANLQQKGVSADKIIFTTINYIFSTVFMVWQTIIIKNNISSGKNNLLEALQESLPKAVKLLMIMFLIGLIVIPTLILLSKIQICAVILPFVAIPALLAILPFLTMLMLGIILRDGDLKEIVISSAGMGVNYYFPILGRIVVIILLNMAISLASIIPLFMFGVLGALLLGPLLLFLGLIYFIIYIAIYTFSNCYFVEMYIDFASEEKPLDIEEELLTDLPADTINSQQPQQVQQIISNQIPEGMRPLGEDYKNNDQQ